MAGYPRGHGLPVGLYLTNDCFDRSEHLHSRSFLTDKLDMINGGSFVRLVAAEKSLDCFRNLADISTLPP